MHRASSSRAASSITINDSKQLQAIKMLSRPAMRAPAMVARRGFHSTRPQLVSPYHYPTGPRSNLPFDPLKKYFWVKYYGFLGFGFSIPFLLAYYQLSKNAA